MHHRTLGADGPLVSAIGLGCMSFAGFYGGADDETSHATLDAARRAGIDFLDTANVYGMGHSERVIGRWLRANPNARMTIATKGGIRRDAQGRRSFDNSPDHLRAELEGSLERLGVSCVALYYVHRREPARPIEEVAETLAGFREEGLIGGFGFSEIAPSSLRRAHAIAPVMAVQSEYSLWSREPEIGMIQACEELGVAFVPFSPLARGMMSQVPLDVAGFGEKDFRRGTPRFSEPNLSANMAKVDEFRALADALGTTAPALAMAWVLAQGDHLVPIPGTRTPEHLAEWVGAADMALDGETLARIDAVLPPGWAHGPRYSEAQAVGAERYC